MSIRKATMLDLDKILEIKEISRNFMIKNNNELQWIDDYPQEDLLISDINNEQLYVVVIDDEICGFFMFKVGIDETYLNIYDGNWLNDEEYGVIHRVASNFKNKNIFQKIINYCLNIVSNIRIDTYKDNKIMLHLLEKYNFVRCGTIYVNSSKNNDRIAFQLTR